MQSRLRGMILMALSNKFGHLLLTTGNKSELAVGYCTIYGDMAGGLAVISDVPKTIVYQLARWINSDKSRAGREREIIPRADHRKTAERRVEARPGRSGFAAALRRSSIKSCSSMSRKIRAPAKSLRAVSMKKPCAGFSAGST